VLDAARKAWQASGVPGGETRMKRKYLLAIVAVFALTFGTAEGAGASASWNGAFAFSGPWDKTGFDLAFDTPVDGGPYVRLENRAYAFAGYCNGCRSIAIAVQIDLIEGTPRQLDLVNIGQAETRRCVGCLTVTAVHQFVVVSGANRVWITDSGRQQLRAIKQQLSQLRRSKAPGDEITAKIDGLMGQIVDVLIAEVRTSGNNTATTAPDASARTAAPVAPTGPRIDHRGSTVANADTDNVATAS
jgi:hypothetical protein